MNYIINLPQMEGSNLTNFPEMETRKQQRTNNEEQIQEDISIGIRQYEQSNLTKKMLTPS